MSSPPSSLKAELWQPNRERSQLIQSIVKWIFGLFALVSVATTIGIVLTLIFETIGFFPGNFLVEISHRYQVDSSVS